MKKEKTNVKRFKKLKNDIKGITLIALVVTIIVLLILAGIALNLTIGENGIFSRAQIAANTWKNAESNEQLAMGELGDWMDSVSGDSNGDETEPTYTSVYAQLYDNEDGTETLIFTSDDSYRENGLTYEQSYNITNEHFWTNIFKDEENSEIPNIPPWSEKANSINKVKIVNEIKPKYTSLMFTGLTALENIEMMENLNTENTVDMSYMFAGCSNLTSLDLSNFNTTHVTNMKGMFLQCFSLINLELGNFDNSNVRDMTAMFYFCKSLKSLDLKKFYTNNVTNMTSMFIGCSSLKNLDLSSFNTNNVTNMSYMFAYSEELTTIYVGQNWTTENKNVEGMFESCGTDHVTLKS